MRAKSKYDILKLSNQACFPLYAAARKITGMYTPFLKPLDLSYIQYVVLLALWEENDLSVGDLCVKLYLDSGTLTPILKKMENKKWLKRVHSTIDERVVIVHLTEEGLDMRKKCLEIPKHIATCVPFTKDDIKYLHKILYQILEEF